MEPLLAQVLDPRIHSFTHLFTHLAIRSWIHHTFTVGTEMRPLLMREASKNFTCVLFFFFYPVTIPKAGLLLLRCSEKASHSPRAGWQARQGTGPVSVLTGPEGEGDEMGVAPFFPLRLPLLQSSAQWAPPRQRLGEGLREAET